MKYLSEIVELVNSGIITNPEKIFGFDSEKDPKSFLFYHQLLKNKFETDGDAIKALYSMDGPVFAKGSTDKSTFNTLKSRLKEKLYSSVLFPIMDIYTSGSYMSTFIFCYRYFIIARLLILFEAKASGAALMKKVLKRSLEYEIFEIAMLCTLSLRRSALLAGDQKAFLTHDSNLKIYIGNIASESEAEGIYYGLVFPFSTKLYISPGTKEAVSNGLKYVKKLLNEHPTIRLHFVNYNIKILDYQVNGKYEQAVKTCDAALAFLEQNEGMKTPTRMGNILLQKMESLLLLKDYSNGAILAARCLTEYREGSEDWFNAQGLFFLICMNASPRGENEHLIVAASLYTKCKKHNKYNTLPEAKQEKWDIYGGYLWFILTYHGEKNIRDKTFAGRTTFSKIDSIMKILGQDKKGANISYLVLKNLLLIQGKKTSELSKSAGGLKSYLSTEMRAEQTRDRIFIRLLIAMIENEMPFYKNTGRTKRLVTALAKSEITKTATQAQIEVISYSLLWPMIENMIKNHK